MQLSPHLDHSRTYRRPQSTAIDIITTWCFVIHLLVSTTLFFKLILKVNLHLSVLESPAYINIQHMSCPSTRQKVPGEQKAYHLHLGSPSLWSTELSALGGAKEILVHVQCWEISSPLKGTASLSSAPWLLLIRQYPPPLPPPQGSWPVKPFLPFLKAYDDTC